MVTAGGIFQETIRFTKRILYTMNLRSHSYGLCPHT